MNWYKYIKKADQPIPGRTNVDDIKNEEGWYSGPELINNIIDEKKQKQEENKYQWMKDLPKEQIKSGNIGVVYIYGDKAYKYTSEESEFKAAEHIIKLQKQYKNNKIPGFAKVYSARKLYNELYDESSEKQGYMIVLEKVTDLKNPNNIKMFHIINFMNQSEEYGGIICHNQTGNFSPDDEKMIKSITSDAQTKPYYQPYSNKPVKPTATITENDVYYVVLKYCELFHKIKDVGGSIGDLSSSNIGITNDGEWVLLDVGGSFFL